MLFHVEKYVGKALAGISRSFLQVMLLLYLLIRQYHGWGGFATSAIEQVSPEARLVIIAVIPSVSHFRIFVNNPFADCASLFV